MKGKNKSSLDELNNTLGYISLSSFASYNNETWSSYTIAIEEKHAADDITLTVHQKIPR